MSPKTIAAVIAAIFEFAKMIVRLEGEQKRLAAAQELALGLRLKNETQDTALLEKAVRDHLVADGRKL